MHAWQVRASDLLSFSECGFDDEADNAEFSKAMELAFKGEGLRK